MTLYEILQVTEKAEKEVIVSAYRGLVRKYHPDVSKLPEAERKMAEINNAYAVLSDPVKRFEYDKKLHSERDARNTSTAGYSSQNYQTYNAGVKKEYVRPQPPKTEQKNETPPPRKTGFDKNTTFSQRYNVPSWTSEFFRGINENISQSEYAKLGIYSSINESGDLVIVDSGKRSFMNQLRFVFFLIIFQGIVMYGLSFVLADYNRFMELLKVEPITVIGLSGVTLLFGWSAYILRPKRYRLVFMRDSFTISLHKIFKRKISYSRVFSTELIFGDPNLLKIHLRNGKKIKTMRYSNAMQIVHEIIGVIIKNRV